MENYKKKKIFKKIRKYFSLNKSSVTFVHTDISRSFRVRYDNRYNFFNNHYKIIKECALNSALWFPSFNYDFSKKNSFNPKKDSSHTDKFTEFFRKNIAKWRTPVPIFSITGDKKNPKIKIKKNVNPFGKQSIFHKLYNKNANIFFYGAPINSASFIMYIEETFSGGPIYRYKKVLKGNIVIKKNLKFSVNLKLHVRPKNPNYYLEYDWKKIENNLKKNNLIQSFNSGLNRFKMLNLKKVTIFLHKKLDKDPFFLIDKKSQEWVVPLYKKLKRRFELKDFEKS